MKTKNTSITCCILSTIIFLFFFNTKSVSQAIVLTNNGTSAYKIIASSANPSTYKTAQSLSSFIKQMSGATIPVSDDDIQPQEKEIIIGNNKHTNTLHLNIDPSNMKDNECIIKTFGNTILLYGKNDSDAIDCVYWFIQKYLGCYMLSSEVTIVPHNNNITLTAINDDYTPPFTYRDLYYKDTYDSMYTKFNRIDHFDAGGQNRKWGEIWSSSFMYVIPANKYFTTHPEYFALNEKGKRIPNQLDLTNEDLFKEYIKNFRRLMQRFPNSKIWSVAPNDASVPNYCKCDKCQAINKREGTPMGALLTFVNRVAAQFPDKIITTQAYMFYEEPPKTIKPAPNVLIVEAGSYLLNHAVPYETSNEPDVVTYRRRLEGWLALTNNVRIWDYVIDFFYPMCPFPNLEVQQKNLQYFSKLGIKDVFMQGRITKGGEFSELRAWLLARLLWNPGINYDDAMDYFLNHYYGKAGAYIKKYISLTTASLLKSGIPLTVHDSVSKHSAGFLAPRSLAQYNQIFDSAERAVNNNAIQLDRVKTARLSLMYAMLETYKASTAKNKSNVNTISYPTNKNPQDLLEEFVQLCKKYNIVKLSKDAPTVDSYQADFIKHIK